MAVNMKIEHAQTAESESQSTLNPKEGAQAADNQPSVGRDALPRVRGESPASDNEPDEGRDIALSRMRDPRTAQRSVPTRMLLRVQAKPALECGSPLPLCRSADSLVRAVSVSTLLGDGRAAGLSSLPMPYRTRDFDRVFHLVSACFTWFQLSGKKNRNGEAENLRFQLRGTDAQQVFADCQCPYHARFTYESALRDFHAFGCGVLHLVAACCGLLQLRGKI